MNLDLLKLLNSKFEGRKTYTVAIVAILSGALAYLSGEATLMAALQLAFTGVMGATVRHGVTVEASKAVATVATPPAAE